MLFLGMILRTGFMTPMMFTASLILILRQNASLGKVCFSAIPFLILGVVIIAKRSEPISKSQQKLRQYKSYFT